VRTLSVPVVSADFLNMRMDLCKCLPLRKQMSHRCLPRFVVTTPVMSVLAVTPLSAQRVHLSRRLCWAASLTNRSARRYG
jgi:hypothetical protein